MLFTSRQLVQEYTPAQWRMKVTFGSPLCLSSQHLQQQAFLVLQENQVLLDQLETQHSSYQSEGKRFRVHIEGIVVGGNGDGWKTS